MTTYPVNMPTVAGIQSAVLSMDNATSLTASPFSYAQQAYNWGGARWRIDFTPPPMRRADAEEWIAFTLSLRGQFGTFLAGDPSATTPRGSAGGTPLVNGGGQSGGTLVIDGCPINTTGWLRKGDYFQLGSGSGARLYKLIEDANTNGSGQTTLEFVPNLRTPPNDNAALTTTNARGLFRLDSNSTSWSANPDGTWRISFGAVEAL